MAGAQAEFAVLLTEGAEQDLESIHDYICEFDCIANANHVLDELMAFVDSLSKFPQRGSYPKELVSLGRAACIYRSDLDCWCCPDIRSRHMGSHTARS
jgi:plasmid stabilization system protein ParE